MANYFAPAFRIDVNGSQLQADISKNIEQVSIVSKPDTLDTFTLSLANAYPKLRWTHTDDADLFQEGNSVRISLGYVGQMQMMLEGEITKISPSFPESGMPSISIEGHTRLHWLQGDKKTRTFQNMTDKQMVGKIAQEAGLEPKAEDDGVQYSYVMQNNQTDLEFIQARAQRIRFEVLVDGKTLIFRKAKEADSKVYTLVWGHTQEALSQSKTLPLRSFTPSMNTMQQATDVTVRGYDPKSKKEIVARAGAGDEATKMGGKQAGGQVASSAFRRPRQFVRVSTPVATQEEAQQHANAIYNARAMDFITGDAATIGIPDLRAGAVVEIAGVGPRFSGLYYIDEATHTIADSGYQTGLKLKRNAV
ncbi:MAG TPA: contractile injection system protein, VgrG/Pvc8 family [Bryobacteraceae bacterium]|nr:contractile injection system protein, VgrG/Pvc8 family [Bryobacteraceae bacterium]